MINSLIGLPYKVGTEGPNFYDCWGLAKKVQKELFSREMPSIKDSPDTLRGLMTFVKDNHARKQWVVSENFPVHGQLVELSKSSNPFHIGVYLEYDGGGILHCLEKVGVCYDRIKLMQVTGWRKMVFHDWIG